MKKYLLLLPILFITGCTSYIELNDLAIINAIGIESIENEYHLTASIVDTKDIETNDIKTIIYETKGNSINKIIDDLSLTLNKKIYISHLDLLLINESIKTKEFEEITNFFLNNNESREDFLVVFTSDIKKVLENTKLKEINDLIEINQNETSKSIYTTMHDVINNYYLKNDIYLTNIEIDDKVKILGLKKFKSNKYETIESNDTLFINYILNNIKSYKYSLECSNNNYLYLNILKSNINELNKKYLITNEIKVISNECNLTKDEINEVFNNYLKENLSRFANKEINIKNTIRGLNEN